MIITVDTGGTKTLIASFFDDGTIAKQIKFPTPKDTVEYTALIRKTLQDEFGNRKAKAIAIAIPGTIKNGVAVWCNNLKWKDFDVAKAFKGVLGDTPVFVDNDANLAGLAETRSLKTNPTMSLYVTISTGIGTGIITNGKIDPGLRYSEGGRALVEYDGLVREWESFGSGRAIYETYGKYAADITSERTWRQASDRMSRGFLAIIPILQPDIIIIGGSIGTYFDRYSKFLIGILKEKLPAHIPVPKMVQAAHPEQAVIYGCYYYAIDCLADQKA